MPLSNLTNNQRRKDVMPLTGRQFALLITWFLFSMSMTKHKKKKFKRTHFCRTQLFSQVIIVLEVFPIFSSPPEVKSNRDFDSLNDTTLYIGTLYKPFEERNRKYMNQIKFLQHYHK